MLRQLLFLIGLTTIPLPLLAKEDGNLEISLAAGIGFIQGTLNNQGNTLATESSMSSPWSTPNLLGVASVGINGGFKGASMGFGLSSGFAKVYWQDPTWSVDGTAIDLGFYLQFGFHSKDYNLRSTFLIMRLDMGGLNLDAALRTPQHSGTFNDWAFRIRILTALRLPIHRHLVLEAGPLVVLSQAHQIPTTFGNDASKVSLDLGMIGAQLGVVWLPY